MIYRLDEEGHALVLHDDELPEVVALGVEPGGAVLAALVAAPGKTVPRPALRLQLPDGVQVGTRDETVGILEESTGPTLRVAAEMRSNFVRCLQRLNCSEDVQKCLCSRY